MSRDYLEATQRELENWPGASMDSAIASKHRVITIHYRGQSRKVFLAATPSDVSRGLKNHLSVVRRELAALGAKRTARDTSGAKQRTRNRPQRPPMFLLGRARPLPNPFAVLASLFDRVQA